MSAVIQALNAVQKELKPIAKDDVKAGNQRYKAFGVDKVYANIGPLFVKNGIVVLPQLRSVDYGEYTTNSGNVGTSAHVVMDYVFAHVDGDSVHMTVAAEGRDTTDKATNKALQQAFKYGLIQAFQIATGEVDPDAAEVEPAVSQKTPNAAKHENAAKLAAFEAAGMDKDEAKKLYAQALEAVGFDKVETAGQVKVVRQWLTNNMVQTVLDATEAKEET